MTSMIDLLMGLSVAQAVGWALLQFVWQGTVLGLLTALLLALLRRSAPDIRYLVSTIGLALMLTMPVVTAVQAVRTASRTPPSSSDRPTRAPDAIVGTIKAGAPTGTLKSETPAGATKLKSPAGASGAMSQAAAVRFLAPAAAVDAPVVVTFVPPIVESFVPWLPLLVLGWMCGVMLLSLRLASGWFWVQGMKRHRAVAAADRWQQTARRLSRQLHIHRQVRLLESAAVAVPTVIGWLRPIVLLPTSALAGLSPQQVEAILAHELAHIRRHDYLVNLLQTLVETLLFYHPAVWWLSRRIRAERENCCDDLAVSLCGDPYTYAKALADLEELRGTSGRLVLAATGGSLLHRVRRLVGAPSHAGRGPGWAAGLAAVLLITGVAAGAIGNELLLHDRHPLLASNLRTWDLDRPRVDLHIRDANAVIDILAGAREATHALALGARDATHALAAGARDAKRALLRGSQLSRRTRLLSQTRSPLPPIEPDAPLPPVAPSAPVAPEAPALAERPSPPAAPQAPTPPDAPVAPAAPRSDGRQSHGNFSWSNGREKLDVRYDGDVEFAADDSDVTRMSPGGYLKISDGGWLSGRTVEFRADGSGRIERRFWVGSSEKPFEPDGRRWLADSLPRLIRQTGIGAASRVARFLKAGGPPAVLAEISLIEGSWAKRVYFSELLKASSLDAATRARVLAQAGREIDSDFELASLLIASMDQLIADDTTRKAYLDAARSIGSDFELRRVLSSALARVATSPGLLASLLDASASIDSDFEEASLLVQVSKSHALDGAARGAFFKALSTIQSDFEHRRVLSALVEHGDLSEQTVREMLESSSAIGSDFEQATFLTQIASQRPIAGGLGDPFFRAVANVDSPFERGRVLQAVVKRPDASEDVLVGVLRAIATMKGSFEASQVLQAIAAHHRVTGQARDLYIDIAGHLGQFEQGQALTALVKAERR
jgi:beta-lactamase regulating signal transducer with metallopeptidase domain